jgi:hypothetical protein
MELNSANQNFSQVLSFITEKLNNKEDSFEKFKLLSTFNYVVRNNTLNYYCQQGNISEAMTYLQKLSPQAPVPRYISILTKCGITVTENVTEMVLIPKNKEKGKILKIQNDSVGSGKDAVQVAAVQFASVKDGRPYLIDFNIEERKRKIEEHSEGKVKYEDYLNTIRGEVSDKEYKEIEILDNDGEVNIKPEFDANIKGIHHPDTAQEVYEIFKGTGYGFRIKILKKKNLEFASPGFSVKNVENIYTFSPLVETEYVKGPENDKLIEYIIDYLEKVSIIKKGDKIGNSDYDPKIAYKEACKTQSPTFIPDVAIRTIDDTEVERNLLKGVPGNVIEKYLKVKFDFEEHRDNIQIQKDKYLELQDRDFKAPNSIKRAITGLKTNLRGLSFAQMIEQGTKIMNNEINNTNYQQSVLARSGVNYAGKDRHVYMSLFLDVLIRSPAQFPKMYLSADSIYRFESDFRENKVDKNVDPYEINKIYMLSQLAKIKEYNEEREIEEKESEMWPTLEEQMRASLTCGVGPSGIPPPAEFCNEEVKEQDETLDI